jgi:hypothetical protein
MNGVNGLPEKQGLPFFPSATRCLDPVQRNGDDGGAKLDNDQTDLHPDIYKSS